MAIEKPLKRSPGTRLPRQFQSDTDLISAKGIALEGLSTHTVERSGNDITFKDPSVGTKSVDQVQSTARVSGNDTTPANLLAKIVAGAGITINELNDGGNEALELVADSAIGTVKPYPFVTTGNTNDKWLGAYVPSTFSNDIPLIIPQNADIKGILFSNQDDDVDIDIQIYKNAILSHTEKIRNKRWHYNVGFNGPSFLQGDRMSVFLKKFTGGTGDQTAQDPVVTVLVKFTNEAAGTGGAQNGV